MGHAAEATDSLSRSPASEPADDFGATSLAMHQRHLWLRLGIERCRVWAIDLGTDEPTNCRWMSSAGRDSGQAPEVGLDAAGPGVAERLVSWAQPGVPVGSVVTHMLSPRRWVLFWRVDTHAAVLVQVRHVHAQTSLDADSTCTVQVLCEQWLAPDLAAISARHAQSPAWNLVDRRSRGAVPRRLVAAMAATVLTTAAMLWLASAGAGAITTAADAQRRDVQRLADLADQTMLRGLSHVLATGDYGELQELLSEKTAIGQLEEAVVLNARELAVAQVGTTPGVRLGASMPPALVSSARTLPLAKDGQPLGRLVIIRSPPPPTANAAIPAGTLRVVASLAAGAGVLTVLMLGWHMRSHFRGWRWRAERRGNDR